MKINIMLKKWKKQWQEIAILMHRVCVLESQDYEMANNYIIIAKFDSQT